MDDQRSNKTQKHGEKNVIEGKRANDKGKLWKVQKQDNTSKEKYLEAKKKVRRGVFTWPNVQKQCFANVSKNKCSSL